MAAKALRVFANWDADARMWYVVESDIPGLVTEAATWDALVARVVAVAPELLELNRHLLGADVTPFAPVNVLASQEVVLAVH